VALYRFEDPGKLHSPVLVAALDGWIDAGGASTTAAELLADGGKPVATFDGDIMFDYRSRRPTLDIIDGRLSRLDWPELIVRRANLDGRDLLVLAGAEPDFRWHEFAASIVELVARLGVVQWVSLGAIPAAVPHTRPVPIIGSASAPGLLKGDVQPGPQGRLRVPSAALSVLEMSVADAGTEAVGYYAQVPHYVSGPYATAALELLRALSRHLGIEVPTGSLESESRDLRSRLDLAAAADETTRTYVERLEAMVDEERLPTGDELINDIERFLRDRGGEGTQRS
jgi:proteasome assembly chaperone (PAC2) family protein